MVSVTRNVLEGIRTASLAIQTEKLTRPSRLLQTLTLGFFRGLVGGGKGITRPSWKSFGR